MTIANHNMPHRIIVKKCGTSIIVLKQIDEKTQFQLLFLSWFH